VLFFRKGDTVDKIKTIGLIFGILPLALFLFLAISSALGGN
jgi:hypothetical protein